VNARILGSTLLAAALSTQASLALAAPATPPSSVTISRCSGGVASVELMEIATYDVTFRNETSMTIERIGLSARYGRHEKRATFDLTGPFAPGVEYSRHLRRTVNGGLFGYRSEQNDCFVDSVKFANGTTWRR